GGVNWGPAALVDPDEVLVDWFGRRLGGEAGRDARVFVTGRNEWSSIDGFDAAPKTLWLSSAGRANTRRGDGRLVTASGGEQPADRFVHDPDRPVPWQLGGGSFSRSGARLALDTAFATARDDVLVYDADPVAEPMLVRGRPVARLWVQSSAQ